MVTTIDLFAGAGGLSIGAKQAGTEPKLLVDFDGPSCDTLRLNEKYHPRASVLQADVSTLTGDSLRHEAGLSKHDTLIVIGGPPCQPFSKAAYWTEEGSDSRYRRARARGEDAERPAPPTEPRADDRRTLVEEFFRLIIESNADGFVFENVPSLLHPRNRPVFEAFCEAAKGAGYQIASTTANAAAYGVAQRRMRVFILGSRRKTPQLPLPTHSIGPSEGDGALLPAVSAKEAISQFSEPLFSELGEAVEGRWAQHLREIPPGMNYKHHTEWAGHPTPTFVTETRFWNFLLKLAPDQPSWTISASPGPWTGPFHWDSRRLRTMELAMLQGFPADYRFAGNRRERVRQIGNAVPAPLARAMVEAVLDTLR